MCLIITSLFFFNTLFAASEPDPKTLKVALLPDENGSTVIKNNEGLKRYLESSLGKNRTRSDHRLFVNDRGDASWQTGSGLLWAVVLRNGEVKE